MHWLVRWQSCKRLIWSLALTPRLLIWQVRPDDPYGCSYRLVQTGDGWQIETTAPGIRPCACSGNANWANGTRLSKKCGRHCWNGVTRRRASLTRAGPRRFPQYPTTRFWRYGVCAEAILPGPARMSELDLNLIPYLVAMEETRN